MKKICLIAIMFFSGCAVPVEHKHDSLSQTWTLEQGLLDKYALTGIAEITQKGNVFTYKANGQCMENNSATECMWWGVRWTYPETEKPLKVHCNITKTVNTEPGNKRSLFTPSIVQYQVDIDLPAHSKEQFLVNKTSSGKGSVTIKASCKMDDKILAEVKPMTFDMVVNFVEDTGK